MKLGKINIAFRNRFSQSDSPRIFKRLVNRNRPRRSFAARTSAVVTRVLVSSLCIQRSLCRSNFGSVKFQFGIICQRLSYEPGRCRVIRRNGGILRPYRSKASDQYTNGKSENVLPHNYSTTAIPTNTPQRRKTPPSNPQREDLVMRRKKERAALLPRERKTANCF